MELSALYSAGLEKLVALANWQRRYLTSSAVQVYKGVRSGVQPVAVKVLNEVNDPEAAKFAEVRRLRATICVCLYCTI